MLGYYFYYIMVECHYHVHQIMIIYALIINSEELRKVERTEAFGVMMMKNS